MLLAKLSLCSGYSLGTRLLSVFVFSTTDTSDYMLFTSSVVVRPNQPKGVQLSIVNDSVALEPNEAFSLTLEPSTPLAVGEFMVETLTVIIQDDHGESNMPYCELHIVNHH